jgi:hypothetical protein
MTAVYQKCEKPAVEAGFSATPATAWGFVIVPTINRSDAQYVARTADFVQSGVALFFTGKTQCTRHPPSIATRISRR